MKGLSSIGAAILASALGKEVRGVLPRGSILEQKISNPFGRYRAVGEYTQLTKSGVARKVIRMELVDRSKKYNRANIRVGDAI